MNVLERKLRLIRLASIFGSMQGREHPLTQLQKEYPGAYTIDERWHIVYDTPEEETLLLLKYSK